jgi:predicted nucleic acid-binding Zn ribbon protein
MRHEDQGWKRQQRFDMRVLAVLALIILVTSVIMLTFASDLFWGAFG